MKLLTEQRRFYGCGTYREKKASTDHIRLLRTSKRKQLPGNPKNKNFRHLTLCLFIYLFIRIFARCEK